jgi:hypothetical protein
MSHAPWTFRSVERYSDVITIRFRGRIWPMSITIPIVDAARLAEELKAKLPTSDAPQ